MACLAFESHRYVALLRLADGMKDIQFFSCACNHIEFIEVTSSVVHDHLMAARPASQYHFRMLQEDARIIVRDRTDGCTSGAGVLQQICWQRAS